MPFARGACRDLTRLVLRDNRGAAHEVQCRALDRWGDGSVRWALVDFFAEWNGDETVSDYALTAEDHPAALRRAEVRVVEERGGLSIDTGVARFVVRAGDRFPFDEAIVRGVPAIDVAATGLHLEDVQGTTHSAVIERIESEDAGPLRAAVCMHGSIGYAPGQPALALIARLDFFAGSSTVRFAVTVRNPRPAAHKGGYWELGDEASALIRDLSFVVSLPGGQREPLHAECSPEPGLPLRSVPSAFELFQASSGGEHWRSLNHVNDKGVVPLEMRGYQFRMGEQRADGLRATPIATLGGDASGIAMAMPQFWQNFPKSIEASGRALTLRLFPREHADTHELQGGEQKTHIFFVAFGKDDVSDVPLDWVRAPLFAHATADSYCSSGAVPYLTPAAADPHREYLALVNEALEGEDTIERKREFSDEYGWRHFGDLYADHEAVMHAGPTPLLSHYNNQYDAIAGFAYQFMRTGDLRWWRFMSDLAAHVVDIDIYHTNADKAAYNHGLFWHTAHYVDVGRATHRSYPRATGVHGGGPSPEHNYAKGLVWHHLLTGEPSSRESVLGLGQWVINMDDGRQTVFRFLAGGATGVASATADRMYHGPGRGAGNSIAVLVDAHLLSGDVTFLTKAESLIRRCINPADDIAARDLLNAELRWSYTVFLHTLGRYLDYKRERGQVDESYRYARQSLLAYARWMRDHEYPYLDKPEKLEYPTETWVAQDLWKSEVFDLAAKYADAGERAGLLERGDYFFRYAIGTLTTMKTRTLTRPLVLLLSRGLIHAYFAHHPGTHVEETSGDVSAFGPPERFVPQKHVAKQRFVMLAGGLAALALVLVIYAIMRLVAR